jgi:hypothetical protein
MGALPASAWSFLPSFRAAMGRVATSTRERSRETQSLPQSGQSSHLFYDSTDCACMCRADARRVDEH